MGDPAAVATLIDQLEGAGTVYEAAAAAHALGLIGDRRAITPLLAIVEDPENTEIERGFACVALGMLSEKTDLPWNAPFSVNANYLASVPALAEILDIL